MDSASARKSAPRVSSNTEVDSVEDLGVNVVELPSQSGLTTMTNTRTTTTTAIIGKTSRQVLPQRPLTRVARADGSVRLRCRRVFLLLLIPV